MSPINFFSTSNRKKVAAYLIRKGNHSTSLGAIEEATGVMYRTVRDILIKAEKKGFLIKEKLEGKKGKGVRIELLKPMLESISSLRETCAIVLPGPKQDADKAVDELGQLSDADYERIWPNFSGVGWNPELTTALIHRLESRGVAAGGLKPSFDHIEFILSNSPPRKSNEDLLMHFFRILDEKGYIAMPPGYIPSDITRIICKDQPHSGCPR